MKIYFGENLKQLRLNKNLTQEKLADFFDVSFQTISKWERGENYPDITMLPELASFFNVSVDSLLGTNRAEEEKEITNEIYNYDNLMSSKESKRQLIFALKEKYPHDYRILLRYMAYHIHFESDEGSNLIVQNVYDNIINNCTDDNIRICAKRHIVQHYRNLLQNGNKDITLEDIEKIREAMPYMRDGKDFVACYLYNEYYPEHYNHCREALEELLGMLNLILENSCVWDYSLENSGLQGENYLDYNITLAETMNNIFDMFYGGNYGRQWEHVINNHLHIGYLCMLKDDYDETIASYKKALELAKKFDSLDDITTIQSTLLNGCKFIKKELGSDFVATSYVRKWIKERQKDYPKELINRKDYKDLI